MSRQSLRLHPCHSLNYGASYSAGGASQRDISRILKSRRSQSLLLTPRNCSQCLGARACTHSDESSFHGCAASDASLLSSLLDESCIQESTLVDSFWGLDEDTEPKESTLLEQSTILLANGENSSAPTQASMVKNYSCTDFTVPTNKMGAPPSFTSKYTGSTATLSHMGTRDHALTTGPAPAISFPPSSRRKASYSSFCGTTNEKAQATVARRQNRNRVLCKATAWVFWLLGIGWYQAVTLMSHLNVRRFPKLLSPLIVLLPVLLLLGLGLPSWGPSSLRSVLPSFNMTEWETVRPFPSSSPGRSPTEEVGDGHAHTMAPFTAPPSEESLGDSGSAALLHSEHLAQLEQSLSQLSDRMEAGQRRLEQRHMEVTGLYQALQEGLHIQTDRGSMKPWVSGLLEDGLGRLRGELEDEKAQREEFRQQYVMQQEHQGSRLAELELLLQDLLLRTEEVQRRQESAKLAPTAIPTSVPVSAGVNHESHDALLAEVERLETALGSMREDLRGVIGCQARCEVPVTFQDTLSAQVRQELHSQLYSVPQTVSEDTNSHLGSKEVDLPSPLRWLSEHYVSGADLEASLASLELRLLQNISLRLQQEEERGSQSLTHTVLQTVAASGATMVTEEHVEVMVRNALKLYSQDRTGVADYALESGGGSILSMRCSETYATKTVLVSLFGLPLWYFSQSPRVTIQPHIHPGNCWAFQGSKGYLVIRLSMKIQPSAFSLEHLPKALSPNGNISSAPRQFSVYGLDNEHQEEGKLLGSYTYEEDGDALQTFPVSEENEHDYQIIVVRVMSNWGNQDYTCLYRIRVHGEPSQ